MAKTALSGKAADALKDLDELTGDHDKFVAEIDKAEDAYNGIYTRAAEVANWSHQLTPRYVQHIVETTIASMIDPDLKFQVEPRPKFYDPGEVESVRKGAKALEWLLDWQLAQDRFAEKQRDMLLQERFGGISWAKVYWHRSTRMKKKLVPHGLFPQLVETEEPAVEFDGPCVEVCNNRDLVWDMGATSVERCSMIGHRLYVTYAEALAYQRNGVWKNVEQLKDSKADRAQGDKDRRRQGRIEVWEIWRREENGKLMIYTIGERNTLLAERESPYWHGQMPFVFFSSRKKPLTMDGWSQVGQLKDVQAQLWSVENLTLDALMLSIMPIIMYREDLDDPEALVFEPYARWPVSSPDQVRMWTPEYNQAQVGLPHIQRLKADLQNLAGSQPFTSTDEARTSGANTATEASLVASIAQRSMTTAKTHWFQTVQRIGQQFIELDQQYVRDPVYVTVLDVDQQTEIQEIVPELLQGEFNFSIKPMTESLIRESRRAEATSHFQALGQMLPMVAGLSAQSQGTVPPMNPWTIIEDYLEAFDKGPVERYQMKAPPAAPPPQAAPQQNPQQPPGGQGVTNPALAAGPEAPSNAMTQNPASMMQSFLASQGGGQSV